MVVTAAGRVSFQVVVRGAHLVFSLAAQLVNTVAAVQRAPNLLISFNESLQLNGQVAVLIDQNVAVVLQSIDLRLNVSVLTLQRLVREPQVILFLLGTGELLLSVAAFAL